MFFSSLRQQSTRASTSTRRRGRCGAPWASERVAGLDTLLDESDPFVAVGGLVVFSPEPDQPAGRPLLVAAAVDDAALPGTPNRWWMSLSVHRPDAACPWICST